mmetsp:Transcript_27894/g.65905  ORF Transcript_27894/g.65905 Transcript_27894/m.65905 type:complete len:269 (-) Transcript_27894:2-808(-)
MVRAEQSICSSGTLMPLRDLSVPPSMTAQVTSVSEMRLSIFTSIRPSSKSSVMPGCTPLTSAVCSIVGVRATRPGRVRSLSSTHRPSWTVEPPSSGTGWSPSVMLQRNLGPWMSPRISTLRPALRPASRIHGMSSSNWPGRRCDEFRRKMSTPAATSFSIISWLKEAGPRVETILAFRSRQFLAIGSTIRPMSSTVFVCCAANLDVPPVSREALMVGSPSRVASMFMCTTTSSTDRYRAQAELLPDGAVATKPSGRPSATSMSFSRGV